MTTESDSSDVADRPTSGQGADLGAGEPNTFEPEEDPDAVDAPSDDDTPG